MRITEAQLRRIVREEILDENLESFLQNTHDISYSGFYDNPTFERAPDDKAKARSIKRIWAEEADHAFMRSLIKVHWMASASANEIYSLVNSRGRDEISTMGYLPDGDTSFYSGWGVLGLMVQGRTTLAVNDMDDAHTGFRKALKPDAKEKYRSSGIPKRATFSDQTSRTNYILDRDSYIENSHVYNELVVANWRVTGAVFDQNRFLHITRIIRNVREGHEDPQEHSGGTWDGIFRALHKLRIPLVLDDQQAAADEWMSLIGD
jgi:hypothetical protein